jgi:hypothetical protein
MKTDTDKVCAIVLVILLSGLAGVSIYGDINFKSFPEFSVQNEGREFFSFPERPSQLTKMHLHITIGTDQVFRIV